MTRYWNKERFIYLGVAIPGIFLTIFCMYIFMAFVNNDLTMDTSIIAAKLSAVVTGFGVCAAGIGAWVKGGDIPDEGGNG